jgi:hypothetical protein
VAEAGPRGRGRRDQLLELLSQGAESFGFQGNVWTQPRVATLIRDRFGISYHPDHVGRILKAGGWSSQKPVHRASQRNEAAIQRWKEERWPQNKKRRLQKDGRWSLRSSLGSTCCLGRYAPTPPGSDPHHPRSSEPGPPVGHGRHYSRRQTLPDGAGTGLPGHRRGEVPEALGAARLWKVVGALGRGSHPPEPGGEG